MAGLWRRPMVFEEAAAIAGRARSAKSPEAALEILREMGLDDFGQLLLAPEKHGLTRLLPSMAPAQAQEQWTGASGHVLLAQSVSFVRALESLCARLRQRPLRGARILDYGCGWGRLLRLALYYSDPDKLHGVDPWDKSIAMCRAHRVPGEIRQSDYLPVTLPVSHPADLAFAFSVFTHLSERAARAALSALRKSVVDDGLLVITLRPIEYWAHHTTFHTKSREQLQREHRQTGFAYQPHGNIVADGEAVYGDASMTHAFATRMLEETGWRWCCYDRAMADPFQTIVAATPI